MKQLTKGILIGTVSVLAFISLVYLASNQYIKIQNEILLEGEISGYERAIIDILSLASQCQQVPIDYQNETYNLFLVECLQSQGAQR